MINSSIIHGLKIDAEEKLELKSFRVIKNNRKVNSYSKLKLISNSKLPPIPKLISLLDLF